MDQILYQLFLGIGIFALIFLIHFLGKPEKQVEETLKEDRKAA